MPAIFVDENLEYYKNENGIRVLVPIVTAEIATKTANYQMVIGDSNILADATSGPITITLPVAGFEHSYINVKKIDVSVNAVTVATPAAETIDGAATRVLNNQYDANQFVSDGANWWIVGGV